MTKIIDHPDEPQKEESTITKKIGGVFEGIKRMTTRPEKETESGEDEPTSTLGKVYDQVRSVVGWKSGEDLAKMFRAWVVNVPIKDDNEARFQQKLPQEAEAFTTWVRTLPLNELEAFSEQVATFCEKMNFELLWLVDPEVEHIEVETKQALASVVYLYSLAQWRALQHQDDIKIFVAYRDWTANPKHKKYKPFNQQLFSKLVDKSLVPAPPMDLFMASDKERQAHFMAMIEKVRAENKDAFNAVLKTQIIASFEDTPIQADVPEEVPIEVLPAKTIDLSDATETESP